MGDFPGILKEAIESGESLESAMRKAAAQAAKEAAESPPRTEIASLPGCDRHECSGRNSGDPRNGNCQRTVQASLGPMTIDVPRDGNGRCEPIAIPKCKRKADPIASTVPKLHSSGMTGEEMRPAVSSTYEANCYESTMSSIADAAMEDVKGFSERILPKRLFALFLGSACVPLRRDSAQKEAISLALGAAGDGAPLVVGCSITPQESAESHKGLLPGFKPRGLESAEAVIADGLAGIGEAICASCPDAKRQRRFAHLLRNARSKARARDRSEAAEDFTGIARQEDAESGRRPSRRSS